MDWAGKTLISDTTVFTDIQGAGVSGPVNNNSLLFDGLIREAPTNQLNRTRWLFVPSVYALRDNLQYLANQMEPPPVDMLVPEVSN